jgi:hypothetical protein
VRPNHAPKVSGSGLESERILGTSSLTIAYHYCYLGLIPLTPRMYQDDDLAGATSGAVVGIAQHQCTGVVQGNEQ